MNHSFELIPLTIEARGEVIASNVDEVRELVRAALANINRDLNTDEEFGQAELDVKALKGAEETFTGAKEKALKDAETLHQLFASIDATVEEIRKPRLELEKLIAKRKEEVKSELIAEALGKVKCAPRLRQSTYGKIVSEAIKGKRTLDSMRKALDIAVVVANGNIDLCRAKLDEHAAEHGEQSLPDRDELEIMAPAFLEAELRRRIEAKKAADEKKRLEQEAATARAAEAKAKAELEASKQPAKPAPLPEPPKIGSIPIGSKAAALGQSNVVPFQAAETAFKDPVAEEWKAFKTAVITSFGPLKAAKELLQHPDNQKRASIFAGAVNAAWQAANAKEVAL